MEIFFYNSPLEVPFTTPCSSEFFSDKQVLLISNKSEIIDEFETHRTAIMEDGIVRIIGAKVLVPVAVKEILLEWLKIDYPKIRWQPAKIFVPHTVKSILLEWLKTDYPKIRWQPATEPTDFKSEMSDGLLSFFQQLRIVEKWEGGTMQQSPTSQRFEIDENKFATATADASKYVSMGFTIIVILSLITSLISLKSINDLRQSQVDSILTRISQDQDNDKLYWCERLNQTFRNEIQNQRYIQVCQPAKPTVILLQPTTDEHDLKMVMSENYELALITITRGDYTTFANTKIERGSALWYAKEISRIPSDDSYLKTEDVLKRIIQKYSVANNTQQRCAGIQKVYQFSCKQQELKIIKQEIETKFTDCKPTCSSPTSSGL